MREVILAFVIGVVMTEFISDFLANVFDGNAVLATILISIIPLIELKGAIPFGMSKEFWLNNSLTAWQATGCSVLGGFAITVILAIIFKPIYNWLKDKKFFKGIINFLTASAKKKSNELQAEQEKVRKKNSTLIKFITTLIFVAIPVPGTGVYTGTVLAVMLGLDFPLTILSVTIGNFIAGLIIMFICSIFPDFTNIIFWIFVLFILVFLVYRTFVHFIRKRNEEIK